MVLDLLKQFFGANFLLLIVALGFFLVLTQSKESPVDRKTIRVIRGLIVLALVLATADFME